MSGAPRLSQRSKATPTSPQRVRGWRAPRCQRTQARPYVLRRDLGGLHSAPAVEPGPQRKGDIPKPMMHGMKKSDEAVLPLKAANKGARAPAESPEGRASTKGNLRDQSTHRTQGRDGVSQAVERIRQAATRKPQEETDCALAPPHDGRAPLRLLRPEEDRIGGCGRHGVERVRGRAGRAIARPARPRAFGSVSGAAVAAGCNTQA